MKRTAIAFLILFLAPFITNAAVPSLGLVFQRLEIHEPAVASICGRPVAPPHWQGSLVSQKTRRCWLRGYFFAERFTPTPRPQPTRVPTPRPTATKPPVPSPTATQRPPTATPVLPIPTQTPQPRPTATPVPNDPASYLLSLLNQERASHGYAPLALNETLSLGTSTCVGAIGHSEHMAQQGTISHDQFPADICLPFSTAGENVGEASGYSVDASLQTINSLMLSEPWSPGCSGSHHCNIDDPGYSQIGIGVYTANNTTWLTEDFVG